MNLPMLPNVLRAAASCGACSMAAALGLLPAIALFVFKPLTTLLGLCLSLVGDVFLLWPSRGFLPGLVSFLLAHLAYIAAFCVGVRFAARPLVLAAYAVLAGAILWPLWSSIPPGLRFPVAAYVVCLACMAAQAGTWWRASSGTANQRLAQRAAIGGLLFMASDSLLAYNKFMLPLPLAPLWILLTYWLAQACIAASLRAARER